MKNGQIKICRKSKSKMNKLKKHKSSRQKFKSFRPFSKPKL